jgi:REP element-mobilizing transposase RayT
MKGIAKAQSLHRMAANGVEYHVDLLFGMDAKLSLSKAMQLLKGTSSKWLKEKYGTTQPFAWQEGYGAMSIGVSQVAATLSISLHIRLTTVPGALKTSIVSF